MDWHTFWITIHVIGTAIGVGSVTTTDVYVFLALTYPDEFRISERILVPFRLLVLAGLALLLASGIGLLLDNPSDYLVSEKFQSKMIIVLILLANGVALMKVVTPRLLEAIQNGLTQHPEEFSKLITKSIPITVISTASWYTALILGAVGAQSWSIAQVIGGYAGILILGSIVGLVIASRISFRNQMGDKKTEAAQAD